MAVPAAGARPTSNASSRSPADGRAPIVLGAAFVVLAALVAAGVLGWLDAFAARHLTPGLRTEYAPDRAPADAHAVHALADVVSFPASALVTSLLLAAAAALLWRRGETRLALASLVVLAASAAVELVCRAVVTRPSVEARVNGVEIRDFGLQTSFPSGHATRAVLLAGVFVLLLGGFGRVLAAWAVAVALLEELSGFHTPTDVVGGVLLGAALVAALVPLSLPRGSARAPTFRTRLAAFRRSG